MSAKSLRKRLAEIDVAAAALARDDFAGKHKLLSEADLLRSRLKMVSQTESAPIQKEWAKRAGRKATKTVDEESEQAKARIVSPGEGGLGGGCG